MTSVLVTGANGFVGRRLGAFLVSQGHTVFGAVRNATRLPAGVRAVTIGDIGADLDWTGALNGIEVVVHLAARVHVMSPHGGDVKDYHRVNVDGSERMARQAARLGVRRFVFLSSVKVNGESSTEPLTESDPLHPAGAYGESKAEAEHRLKSVAANTGMELVVLRPPLVYGPGVGGNFLQLLRLVDAGLPLPFSSVDNRRSLVGLENLVNAISVCLAHPAAAQRTFFVSDGEDVSTARLVRETAAALGRPARLFPFPLNLLKSGAWLIGQSEQVGRLIDSLQVDITAIRASLGWAPATSLRAGLEATADWYRKQKG